MFRDTENIRKYRLSASELNYITHQIALKYNPDLQSASANDYHSVLRHNKNFILCPMSKDAESPDNESNVPFIWDTINKFTTQYPDKNYILLLPMRMCRGYLKVPTTVTPLQRKHAVLVVVDLQQNTIKIHDSQGWVRQYLYPDKLNEISSQKNFIYSPKTDYHAYGKQSDAYSCGYYVVKYIEELIEKGCEAGFEKITLEINKEYNDKNDFSKTKYGILIESDKKNEEPDELSDDEEEINQLLSN